MEEVKPVMDLWIVELSWGTHCSSSNVFSTFLRNTSTIVANVINIVLLSLFSEFLHSHLCIASWCWSSSNFTSLISFRDIMSSIELLL